MRYATRKLELAPNTPRMAADPQSIASQKNSKHRALNQSTLPHSCLDIQKRQESRKEEAQSVKIVYEFKRSRPELLHKKVPVLKTLESFHESNRGGALLARPVTVLK